MKEKFTNVWHEIAICAYWVFIYLDLDVKVTQILLILMGIDTIVGILKAQRFGRGFSFKELYFGVATKMLILAAPFVLALVGKGMNYEFKPFLEAMMRIMLVSEGVSILSSIISIKTGKEIKNYDLITSSLKYARNNLIRLGKSIFASAEKNEEVSEENNRQKD